MNQSINQPTNKSTNQSINQSINQSTNQPIKKESKTSNFKVTSQILELFFSTLANFEGVPVPWWPR